MGHIWYLWLTLNYSIVFRLSDERPFIHPIPSIVSTSHREGAESFLRQGAKGSPGSISIMSTENSFMHSAHLSENCRALPWTNLTSDMGAGQQLSKQRYLSLSVKSAYLLKHGKQYKDLVTQGIHSTWQFNFHFLEIFSWRAAGRGVFLLTIIDLIRSSRNSWLILWAILRMWFFFFSRKTSVLSEKKTSYKLWSLIILD